MTSCSSARRLSSHLPASLVIGGGRVIDPLTGFDEIADIAVSSGRITDIGPSLEGAERLDATGLVVAPGFIDVHSHVHSISGQRLQAHDGVTTALDLEAGASPVSAAYAAAAREGRPLNYGFSAAGAALRMQTLAGVPADATIHPPLHNIGNPEWQRAATATEQQQLIGGLESELADGALGVGILLGYAPGTEPGEADPAVPVDGPTEIVRAAAETGARMHYCHINSTSRRHIDRVLALVDKCRHEGGLITPEAYPYGSGSTAIGATFLDPDLLPRWDLTPSSIIYLATGERIADAARLRELRALDPGGLAVVELLREADPRDRALLAASILHSDTIIASDAMPVMRAGDPLDDDRIWPLPSGSVTHPRT